MEDLKFQFSNLYDQYIERIYRFVYLKVSSQETTEDLCAEIFIRVWRGFGERKIDNYQAYIYQVARSVIADHYRNSKIQVVASVEALDGIEDASSLEEQAELNFEIERVLGVLRQLSEDHQNVIIWRYLDELSVSEIAEILGKREEAVRMILHRAMNSLKEKLSLEPPEPPSGNQGSVIKQAISPSY